MKDDGMSLYDFNMTTLDGSEVVDFNEYAGKVQANSWFPIEIQCTHCHFQLQTNAAIIFMKEYLAWMIL